jgi:hypothetical protein
MPRPAISVARPPTHDVLLAPQVKRALWYCSELVAITVLVGLLYWYMEFLKIVPDCARENHHGAGNCPVQLLSWYPKSVIRTW